MVELEQDVHIICFYFFSKFSMSENKSQFENKKKYFLMPPGLVYQIKKGGSYLYVNHCFQNELKSVCFDCADKKNAKNFPRFSKLALLLPELRLY